VTGHKRRTGANALNAGIRRLANLLIVSSRCGEPVGGSHFGRFLFGLPVGFGFAEKVAVGGRDKTHLHIARAVIAEALELSFLQSAQQLALQAERDFTNLVEK
jgi:hypothetical protein